MAAFGAAPSAVPTYTAHTMIGPVNMLATRVAAIKQGEAV